MIQTNVLGEAVPKSSPRTAARKMGRGQDGLCLPHCPRQRGNMRSVCLIEFLPGLLIPSVQWSTEWVRSAKSGKGCKCGFGGCEEPQLHYSCDTPSHPTPNLGWATQPTQE